MTITRRDAVDLAVMAISLAALLARVFALAMADLDEGLREWIEEEAYVPEAWVEQS